MNSLASCELWVDGKRYADGSTGDPLDPSALDGLRISWGRQNAVDQPPPSTCSFRIMDPPGGYIRYDSTIKLGSSVVVWAEVADGSRHIVFAGRVTDLTAAWDDGTGSAGLAVIAVDLLADLANRFVGAEPWPAEELWKRARRILDAVVPGMVLNVPPTPAGLIVSKQDVDRQAAGLLLSELAITGNAVLWIPVTSVGVPYVYYEDPGERAALVTFERDPATGLWAPTTGGHTGTPVSACLVLRDPVDWHRSVEDLVTRATVRWLQQEPDGTTERSVTLTDVQAEATYGARGISVGTILSTSADANTRAGALLAAHQPSDSWRVAGLQWDLRDYPDAPEVTAPVRHNLSPRPSYEGNATGFNPPTGATGTIVQTADAPAGASVYNLKATAAAVSLSPVAAGYAAAVPTHTYRISIAVRQTVAAGARGLFRIQLVSFRTAAGSQVGNAVSGVDVQLTASWQRVTYTTTAAPATAAFVSFGAAMSGLAVNDVVQFDAVLIEDTITSGPFFDGSTANGAGYVHSWDGVPALSPSTATPVPANQHIFDLASALLDNEGRIGLAINLQELPWWAPTEQRMALYIEGGSYEFVEDRWILSLDATPPTGIGATITFAQIQQLSPLVRYADVEPSVEYLDMIGVGAPTAPVFGGPPWSSATKTWSQLTGSWQEYNG